MTEQPQEQSERQEKDELTEERIEKIIERKIKGKDNEEDVDPLEKKVGDLIENKIEEKIDQKLEEKEDKLENIDETGANNDQDLEQAQEEINNSNKISRRSFLKKFGLGAIGFSAMTLTNPVKALDIKDSSGLEVYPSSTHKLSVPSSGAVQIKNTDLELPDGNIGINITSPSRPLEIDSSTAIRIPVGNNSQRPSGNEGDIRINNEKEVLEAYNNGQWNIIGRLTNAVESSGGDIIFEEEINGVTYSTHVFTSPGKSTFSISDLGSNSSVNLKFKMWGGGGGGADAEGGAGGFSSGDYEISSTQSLEVMVGQGGHRGNDSGSVSNRYVASGGGGHVETTGSSNISGGGGGFSGIFTNTISQNSALILAGGGGASHAQDGRGWRGGAGGGTQGQGAEGGDDAGGGGTQTSGGDAGSGSAGFQGEALRGPDVPGSATSSGAPGAGGYYGGGSGDNTSGGSGGGGGGGGSGYIDGAISNGTTETGNYQTPPQSSDRDRNGKGLGGDPNSQGVDGIVYIRVPKF